MALKITQTHITMDNLQSGIRITVRAVIIQNDNILLIKKDSPNDGIHYTLPGGALEAGETLHQAVIRECLEEINASVDAFDVLHIADLFIPKLEPAPYIRHQLEVLIQCRVPVDYSPNSGPEPDKHQVGVEWITLSELNKHTLTPLFFSELLINLHSNQHKIYIGSVK